MHIRLHTRSTARLACRLIACTFALVGMPAGALAQERPNFSGEWTLTSQWGGIYPPAPPGGDAFTLVQTDTELVLIRTYPDHVRRLVFSLDGASREGLEGVGHWRGAELVLERPQRVGQVSTYSLDRGGNLQIISNVPNSDGSLRVFTSIYMRKIRDLASRSVSQPGA